MTKTAVIQGYVFLVQVDLPLKIYLPTHSSRIDFVNMKVTMETRYSGN